MSPFQLKIVYGSKHVTWQLALKKTPMPPKTPSSPYKPDLPFPMRHHQVAVPDLHSTLRTPTHTSAYGPRGFISGLPEAPRADPSNTQGTAGLGLHWEEEESAHRVGRAMSSPSRVQAYSISFIFARWQYISLPTISFTLPSPARSAMSNFDLVDNYFSVHRALYHTIFFFSFTNLKIFWSLPLPMQRCKYCLLSFFGNTICKSFCLCPDPCWAVCQPWHLACEC